MREVNLRTVDLNLLTVLNALLDQRSVTKAGQKIGLSQPATSRALSRLRRLFGDPLLVSSGRSMIPTPRAERLAQPIREFLEGAQRLIHDTAFDPATVDEKFRINAPDATTIVVLSKVFSVISREAPNLDFELTSATAGRFEALIGGDLDFAIDAFPHVPRQFHRHCLIGDRLICVCRQGHPVVHDGLTKEAYASWPHATIDAAAHEILERALHGLGIRRRHAFTTTNFIAAASVVASTDWLLTLPSNLANRVASMLPLRLLELPFKSPQLSLDLLWHDRTNESSAHRWLRRRIIDVTQATFGSDLAKRRPSAAAAKVPSPKTTTWSPGISSGSS
jgi:DNA-binding transcriptional LysR family regulator